MANSCARCNNPLQPSESQLPQEKRLHPSSHSPSSQSFPVPQQGQFTITVAMAKSLLVHDWLRWWPSPYLAPCREDWEASRGCPDGSNGGRKVLAQNFGAGTSLRSTRSNLNCSRTPRRVRRSGLSKRVFYHRTSLQAPWWPPVWTAWTVLHGWLCFATAKACSSKRRKRPFSPLSQNPGGPLLQSTAKCLILNGLT